MAKLPPGARVGVLLESVDRSTVAAEQLLDLVRARARLLAHVQAELFADIAEAARGVDAPEGSLDRSETVQWENGELIGWALCYSGAYGAHQLELAQQLVQRLPMVHQALREGRLDYGRVAAFADALSEVDDDVARRIAQRLLDKGAHRMTLASLREKLRYHIDRLDPDSKRRRYRKRVADRDVWMRETEDGTAILAGSHLPPHRAGAAFDRVDRLARAARADGDARTLSQLRADIARHQAHDLITNPTWRWSLFADDGDLLHHGHTRRRPSAGTRAAGPRFATGNPEPDPRCTCSRTQAGHRRNVIEIQLNPQTLAALLRNPALAPEWAQVVTDITGQVAIDAAAHPPGKWSQIDEYGQLLDHGHTGRFANAVEDAFVRARDRTCRAPTCRTPASRTELDHRIEHDKGGPSHRGCLDARCKRHHVTRHRKGMTITRSGTALTLTLPNSTSFTATLDKDIILTNE